MSIFTEDDELDDLLSDDPCDGRMKIAANDDEGEDAAAVGDEDGDDGDAEDSLDALFASGREVGWNLPKRKRTVPVIGVESFLSERWTLAERVMTPPPPVTLPFSATLPDDVIFSPPLSPEPQRHRYIPDSDLLALPTTRALAFMTNRKYTARWMCVIVNEKAGAAADVVLVVGSDEGEPMVRIDVSLLEELALYFIDAFGGTVYSRAQWEQPLRLLPDARADGEHHFIVPERVLEAVHAVSEPYLLAALRLSSTTPSRTAWKNRGVSRAVNIGVIYDSNSSTRTRHVRMALIETLISPPLSLPRHAQTGWPLIVVRSLAAFEDRWASACHDERRKAARDHLLIRAPEYLECTPAPVLDDIMVISSLIHSCIVFTKDGELLTLPFLRDNDIMCYQRTQ